MTAEYGVEYVEKDGRTFVAGGYTQGGASAMVADPDGFYPKPSRVMRRQPGEWLPVDAEAGAA